LGKLSAQPGCLLGAALVAADANDADIRAGVAGLTTALLFSKKSAYRITVAAKHMPGDYDIEYASPWAGANYLPFVYLLSCQ